MLTQIHRQANESLISIIYKKCLVNSCSIHTLLSVSTIDDSNTTNFELIKPIDIIPHNKRSFKSNHIRNDDIIKILGISLCQEAIADLKQILSNFDINDNFTLQMLLDPKFKYCPLCMHEGQHYLFHQLDNIDYCFIHPHQKLIYKDFFITNEVKRSNLMAKEFLNSMEQINDIGDLIDRAYNTYNHYNFQSFSAYHSIRIANIHGKYWQLDKKMPKELSEIVCKIINNENSKFKSQIYFKDNYEISTLNLDLDYIKSDLPIEIICKEFEKKWGVFIDSCIWQYLLELNVDLETKLMINNYFKLYYSDANALYDTLNFEIKAIIFGSREINFEGDPIRVLLFSTLSGTLNPKICDVKYANSDKWKNHYLVNFTNQLCTIIEKYLLNSYSLLINDYTNCFLQKTIEISSVLLVKYIHTIHSTIIKITDPSIFKLFVYEIDGQKHESAIQIANSYLFPSMWLALGKRGEEEIIIEDFYNQHKLIKDKSQKYLAIA